MLQHLRNRARAAIVGLIIGSASYAEVRNPAATLMVGVGPDRYLNELPQRPDLAKYPLNAGGVRHPGANGRDARHRAHARRAVDIR
ncbi:MAG: hypothetical protein LC791_16930, partial [Acidobacteria bacterium]|nr:hypothetical protein [Acidobacteriota bacterium]